MAPIGEAFIITEEILVQASLENTFASLIAQMGRLNETPDGGPLPMILEDRPGGRWFRDLGGDNGHLWGFVQSIKRPVLLVGQFPDEYRDGIGPGWAALHARVRKAAEALGHN
jgi:hypothetical protein